MRVMIRTGVGGVRGHARTQATALGTRLAVGLAVGLGQVGTVGVLVHAGLGGGQRGISGTGHLDTPGQCIVTIETAHLFTLNSGNNLANPAQIGRAHV